MEHGLLDEGESTNLIVTITNGSLYELDPVYATTTLCKHLDAAELLTLPPSLPTRTAPRRRYAGLPGVAATSLVLSPFS
eukprot:9487555-Pyramimonas_sp.AAC.1